MNAKEQRGRVGRGGGKGAERGEGGQNTATTSASNNPAGIINEQPSSGNDISAINSQHPAASDKHLLLSVLATVRHNYVYLSELAWQPRYTQGLAHMSNNLCSTKSQNLRGDGHELRACHWTQAIGNQQLN